LDKAALPWAFVYADKIYSFLCFFMINRSSFSEGVADNINVGHIVPLPNRCMFDMPQGQGRCKPAFFVKMGCSLIWARREGALEMNERAVMI
jgi:hypothetical protein